MHILLTALFLYSVYATWEIIFPWRRVKSTFRWSFPGQTANETPRYVLITGCDTGFGFELAVKLDGEGWCVVAACLTDDGITRLSEKCSPQLLTVKCDITKPSDVQNLKSFYLGAMEKRGHPKALYGLVNNAGIMIGAMVEWTSLEVYQKMMSVNFFGHVSVTKAFLPLLIEQCRMQNFQRSSARIVDVVSIAGLLASPAMSGYNASKFAFEAFSTCLNAEVYHYGIDVSFVNPSFMLTGLVTNSESALRTTWDGVDSETKQRWGENVFRRIEQTTQIAPSWSESPQKCVYAICHALQASWPKRRYLPGWQAKIMFLIQFLPASFVYGALGVLYKLEPQMVADYRAGKSTSK